MTALPLPGVLQPFAGGPGIDTFRLFVILGAVAAGWTYVRLWRRVAPGAAAGDHLAAAGLGAYVGARLAALAAAGALPGSFWDWLGLAELTLSWAGAGLGALAGAALAARRAGVSPAVALDAAAVALGVGLAAGAWGTARVGAPTALPWGVPLPGAPPGAEAGAHPVVIYLSLTGLAAAIAGWTRFREMPGSGRSLAVVLIVIGLGRWAAGLLAAGEIAPGAAGAALLAPARLGDLAWVAAGTALAVRSRLRPGPALGVLVLALALVGAGLAWQVGATAGFEREGAKAGGPAGPAADPAGQPPAAPVVGFRAPDFEAHTVEGDVLRLSDFRGRPVMLNFWATWCEPCRVEMPEIQRAHEHYGERVAMIGVNVREPGDLVRTFVEAHGYTWRFVLDPQSVVAERYRLRPIPTSFFIDGSGVIRHIEYGIMTEAAIRAVFDRLLQRTDAGRDAG